MRLIKTVTTELNYYLIADEGDVKELIDNELLLHKKQHISEEVVEVCTFETTSSKFFNYCKKRGFK